MNIHEYQGKAVLKSIGAPVSKGVVIFNADEAEAAAKELGGPLWVVKSQIHAGGRGKGTFNEDSAGEKGGVRLAWSIEEVVENAKQMLGNTLVTHQTGPEGKVVNRLYIEDGSDIEKEFYLSLLVDRGSSRVSYAKPGHCVRLSVSAQNQRPLRRRSDRAGARTVVRQGAVDLVANDEQIMLSGQLRHLSDVFITVDHAGGITG